MGETCPCRCQSSTSQDGLCAQGCVRKFIQGLQDGQAELAGTMQQLTMVQHEVLATQKELLQMVTAHIHNIHKSWPQSEPVIPEKRSGLGLDAGRRLVQTYELLELCLLNLPNVDVLLAQRVNKQFKSTIENSSQLQKKLFLSMDPTAGVDWRTEINPMFALENVQNAIPLFFDHKEKRLAYCYRDGRTRLYCSSIRAITARVHMNLTPNKPDRDPCSSFKETAHQRRMLEKGSWKRMYLTQPTCDISWRVQLTESRSSDGYMASERITYSGDSGMVKNEKTLDALLDALANSRVEESG